MTIAANTVTRHPNALTIPAQTHAEARVLATTELSRLIAQIETLDGDDWTQPTDCTAWNVQATLAHLAGACAGYASRAQFVRQYLRNPYMRVERIPIDAINRCQVEDRAGRPPAELLAELRETGPRAIRTRQRIPWLLRILPVPFGEPLGTAPVGYLMNIIYTRDQWMHRADICRATGKRMHLTVDHDARIVALVVRDLARKLRHDPAAPTIDLVLTGAGEAGEIAYRVGTAPQAAATVALDLLMFNRRASDRCTPDEAFAAATISGDETSARWFVDHCIVPY
ncbi:MAG: maleylpyruvate isomerase family mycothiol-dependent enzyme [Anaerolineae bacterium]|nr:maleylpyruvate isomerase family mycothiol-dependent enzyme [Anaerolineae bacterium]